MYFTVRQRMRATGESPEDLFQLRGSIACASTEILPERSARAVRWRVRCEEIVSIHKARSIDPQSSRHERPPFGEAFALTVRRADCTRPFGSFFVYPHVSLFRFKQWSEVRAISVQLIPRGYGGHFVVLGYGAAILI